MRTGISLKNLSVDFDQNFYLHSIYWEIAPEQHWLLCGGNGAGKSALAAVLTGAGQVIDGEIRGLPDPVAEVSFAAQARLIEAERRKDDADILDVVAVGTTVSSLLFSQCADPQLAEELALSFSLVDLYDRAFRSLSTGESRKVMLIRALASKAKLLILDQPFDGLDAQSLEILQAHLIAISADVQMIMVLNRLEDRPSFISHLGFVENGALLHKISVADKEAKAALENLLHLKTSTIEVPEADSKAIVGDLDPQQPLVNLKNICIKYTDNTVIKGLDWVINAGQHWQLSGPNGSGKTALLSLITGDHPQCYVNDIKVFGFKRGSGESIWQIKQYIGYVSTALQWEYRVSISVRNVIISGFYDSIGLYNKSSDRQKTIADQWLVLLAMDARADEPFNKMSYGDQRMLLIARAMVKHPALLILDEPCLGLDDLNRQKVLALIEKICSSGKTTVLYVNHRPDDNIVGIAHHLKLEKHRSSERPE